MKLYGIILDGGENDVFEIECSSKKLTNRRGFSISGKTSAISIGDITNREILQENITTFNQETFSSFWNDYYHQARYFIIRPQTSIPNVERIEALFSISLPLFVAPILDDENLSIPYTHLCFTGIVNNECRTYEIGRIEEKYKAFSDLIIKNKIDKNKNNSFAFIYVSDNEIDFTSINKNPAIKTIRLLPNISINEVIQQISKSFSRRIGKHIEYNNAIYCKLMDAIESNNSLQGTFKANVYLSGNTNSKLFFDSHSLFKVFRYAIDEGYKFSLQINITKYLSNSEITSDDMAEELKPKWWRNDITDSNSLEINERLKVLASEIKNQIKAFKQDIFQQYGYKQFEGKVPGKLQVTINYCNNELINFEAKTGIENALVIEINGKKYISSSNGGYLEYAEFGDNEELPRHINKIIQTLGSEQKCKNAIDFIGIKDSKRILNIIDSEEIDSKEKLSKIGEILRLLKTQKIFIPRICLYGLPGIGKTTLNKKLVDLYREPGKKLSIDDLFLISSDYIINERLFDDNLSSRHNPSVQATNQEEKSLEECVIYSRKDYEYFLNGNHDILLHNLGINFVLIECYNTLDIPDLGGKSVLNEDTRYLLNQLDFFTIFICPDGDPKTGAIFFPYENELIDENKYFEAYFQLYKNRPSLLDKAARRNICNLVENTGGFIDDGKGGHEPKDWDSFKKELYNKIFHPRFHLYNQKYDLKVIRRGSTDDILCNILKGVLQTHIERIEREQLCL